jgi:uncharacterized protein (DUF1499 family)
LRYYLHESRKAVWSQRIALLFFVLFAITFGFHRIGQIGTPVAIKLFGLAMVGAVISAGLGLAALGGIWREGYTGAGKAAAGIVFGALMLAAPLWSLPNLLALPRLHEVSTDLSSPPEFNKITPLRAGTGANPASFQPAAAKLQVKAYPDIKPLPVDRPTVDTYSAVREAVRNLNWRIVSENPPTDGKLGVIEATNRSLIFGFTDDISIRVTRVGNGARIDVRSSARHGEHDLGRNATHVRELFSEVKTKLSELEKNEVMEKTVALREMKMKKALEKKERERLLAEQEERRRQARTAALKRERQISDSGTPAQGQDQPLLSPSQSTVQGAPEQSKRQRREARTRSLRKFWEELNR